MSRKLKDFNLSSYAGVSVTVNQAAVYNISTRHRSKRSSLNNLDLAKKGKEEGRNISDKARLRLRMAINYMVAVTKRKKLFYDNNSKWCWYKIGFMTLTLPSKQIHSDSEIVEKCLRPFIDILLRSHGCKNYVWRAETQANGNIHFHLTVDCYIHWSELRKKWNKCVEKLGYVARFEIANGHSDPNSTDIHSVKNVRDIAAYLSEYIAKKDKNRPVTCRNWACSYGLSSYKGKMFNETEDIWPDVMQYITENTKRIYQSEFVTMLYGDFTELVLLDGV